MGADIKNKNKKKHTFWSKQHLLNHSFTHTSKVCARRHCLAALPQTYDYLNSSHSSCREQLFTVKWSQKKKQPPTLWSTPSSKETLFETRCQTYKSLQRSEERFPSFFVCRLPVSEDAQQRQRRHLMSQSVADNRTLSLMLPCVLLDPILLCFHCGLHWITSTISQMFALALCRQSDRTRS